MFFASAPLAKPIMPGYLTQLFVAQPNAAYRCPICFHVFHEAVLVCKEGHAYCQDCVASLRAEAEGNTNCPECRRTIDGLLHKVRVLNDAIANLQVKCSGGFVDDRTGRKRDCDWTGPLKDRDLHRDRCTIILKGEIQRLSSLACTLKIDSKKLRVQADTQSKVLGHDAPMLCQ